MPTRRASLLAAIAVSALAIAETSCGHACSLLACDEGLTVAFHGGKPGSIYRLEVASVTPLPEIVPIVTCSLEVVEPNLQRLSCSSPELHRETAGRLVIEDVGFKNVQVSVFLSGEPVMQQQFHVVYTTSEINGAGCGTCTRASVEVAIPST